MKEQETISQKPSINLKNLAKLDYEKTFVPTVVAPGDIGVKFDDVGTLEDVKNALNELVILPMRRPELFSHGNLLRILCIAAAYRTVQELLETEKQGGNKDLMLRPLNLDDLVQSKSKVAPSVAYDAVRMNELRKWNEQYGEAEAGGNRHSGSDSRLCPF